MYIDETLEEIASELQELANEAKLRGPGFFGLDVDDWRDIPTSIEELERLPTDDREYWESVVRK